MNPLGSAFADSLLGIINNMTVLRKVDNS